MRVRRLIEGVGERELTCPYFFVTLCINMLGIYWLFHLLFLTLLSGKGGTVISITTRVRV